MKHNTPIWKIAATTGGALLTGSATWLNAVHVASSEGWGSPLVFAGVFVTLCAASAPPLAERAAKTAQPAKAVMIWVFFALALGFSLSSSIARSSGYATGKVASVEHANEKAKLAQEAYDSLKRSVAVECVKRGPKCRELEGKVEEARKALAKAAPVQSTDPGAERIATVLGVNEGSIELYMPLALPFALELGGFIFLALGLAPVAKRREDETEVVANPVQSVAKGPAKRSPAVAKLIKEATKQPVVGTAAYYLGRLEREYPDFANKVRNGELSTFAASVQAGIRKAPKKSAKWTKIDAYLAPEKIEA